MENNPETEADRRAIADYVWRWQGAMGRQAHRTLNPSASDDPEIDLHLFTVALKNLRTSVEWGRNFCNTMKDAKRGEALGKALTAFDERVPHAADVRDVQEHFVAYETSHKSRKHKHIEGPLAIWWEEDYTVLHVGGYTLDVRDAEAAAHEMAHVAMEALIDAKVV